MKMFHLKAHVMDSNHKQAIALDELLYGKEFKVNSNSVENNAMASFDVSREKILQHENKQQLRSMKEKSNYSLFKLYQSNQTMLDTCEPVLSELFTRNENGELMIGNVGEIIRGTSKDNKTAIEEAFDLYKKVDGKPDDLRKRFIKEKVIPNRYSRRGAEFAQLFSDLSDDIFALSTLCVSLQLTMVNLLEQHPEETQA